MGQKTLSLRCVCDTNVVVSALVFSGRMAWLRRAWATRELLPLVGKETVSELLRVLEYPKFQLGSTERMELLGDYLPFCETVSIRRKPAELPQCEDPDDQKFLELAAVGEADWLITGDPHLLRLADKTSFLILKPAEARDRLSEPPAR